VDHAQLHNYLYAILFLFGIVYAAVRGGAPERVGAAIIFIGNILTILVVSPWQTQFDSVEVGVAVVDGLMLIAFVVLMMKANRVWPIWMTSVHGLGFLSHIPILLGPLVLPQAYVILQGMWGWPMMALLIGGTRAHRLRIRRNGTDISWRSSLPPS
jgi:hypothetical protein